ncbi:MAG: hypothetical protein C3F11_20625 [Methylocystaceae bacterium]|nr:MAG: hypothetical protein C3F11_20625 [Methylocystaceae bacterium]
MPVVFRQEGYRFFFYSNEGDPREPVHVHVRKGDATAKFWVAPVGVDRSDGFDARTLRDLARIIEDKAALIERAWHEHFG